MTDTDTDTDTDTPMCPMCIDAIERDGIGDANDLQMGSVAVTEFQDPVCPECADVIDENRRETT